MDLGSLTASGRLLLPSEGVRYRRNVVAIEHGPIRVLVSKKVASVSGRFNGVESYAELYQASRDLAYISKKWRSGSSIEVLAQVLARISV